MVRAAVALLVLAGLAAPAQARQRAPGAPGAKADWAPADKHGFGTSASRASRVWFTLRAASLTEVYYPDLSHPAARGLELWVDGRREAGATRVVRADPASLTYRQTVTARRWRLTKVYVTDPARPVVLVRVRLDSLDGRAHELRLRYDPSLANNGNDDVGWSRGHVLLAHDRQAASALAARPAFGRTSSGYAGRSAGRLGHAYDALRAGNVVQTAATPLTGRGAHRALTLALGFGARATLARTAAQASLRRGFTRVARSYSAGWRAWRARLKPIPAAAVPYAQEYETSLLVLKAHEDKAHPGAFVASPTMPWGWGQLTIDKTTPLSAPYHLVWSRDLYEIATALLVAGDRPDAEAALGFLFSKQQKRDGSFPQNSQVDGRPKWTGLQLDEVAFPLVLAWQLGRTGRAAWGHVRRAADFIVARGPKTGQDRWENQDGYSPGTIAAEIAGLVCAADIARVNGATSRAARYLRTADTWQRSVQRWTATGNGPYAPRPYYLRLTKDK